VALAEAWNGTRWSIVPTPKITGSQATILSAVSCPAAGHCTAVGSYATSAGTGTLAETWNGQAWSISKTPNPAGSSDATLSGVSCPAVNRCVAIGGYVAPSSQPAIAETWNGSAWTIEAVPSPANASGTFLQGLSCRSAADCTAVGSYFNGTGNVTVAEGWNGTAWSIQPVPEPAGPSYATLNAVSCPGAGDCVAVGYSTGATTTTTLAAAWNGHAWAMQPTPNPTGAQQSYLNGVSCPQPGNCTAVGYYAASPTALPLPFAARYQS
jgi:erythromycin esterase-like protein